MVLKFKKNLIENFEKKIKNVANFTIKMSATVGEENYDCVEVTEEELHNDNVKLIKKNLIYNKGISISISISESNEYDDEKILKIALEKFKELKEAYDGAKNDGLNGINPAMLIQVKNSDKNEKKIKQSKI
ncbi:hypothetical protein MSGX11T_00364 [Mycoplasma synoviae GX11-T]|nr:hypothetical protein [Mycoplasmopsis synoviae GX11-T]